LTSTPGVTSVLNGMRTPACVEDSVGVLHWPGLESARAAYEVAKTIAFPKDLG
jgi:aryl-alcohol dehydrogenase-like predicted oxidoreductase